LQGHVDTNDKSIWRRLEAVTIARAFFMICIVARHTEAFIYSENWGAAYFLITLAGYSVARFQLPEIIRTGSVRTLWGTIRSVAIPTLLMVAFLELAIRKFELPALFLVSNFADPTTIRGYTFYFVEIYIQIILLAAILFSVPFVRESFRLRPMVSALVLFAATVILDGAIESVWNGDYNYDRSPWHYSWSFALGMVLSAAKDLRTKLLALAISVAAVLIYWGPTSAAYYVGGGCAFVLFVRRLSFRHK